MSSAWGLFWLLGGLLLAVGCGLLATVALETIPAAGTGLLTYGIWCLATAWIGANRA